MRYFELESKPCRALPFDRQLLGGGNNRERLATHNVFVKLPRSAYQLIGHKELERLFEVCGRIRSLKVSLKVTKSARSPMAGKLIRLALLMMPPTMISLQAETSSPTFPKTNTSE